ncbi:MAG: RNA-guided endonuclease TnpB family protein [Microcoleus sp.]
MITAYKYKLRPNKAQSHQFDEWLNLLRMQYNYRLSERFKWYESNRCPVDSCSLGSCSIAPIIEQPDYFWQKRDLLNTKKLFPQYKSIHYKAVYRKKQGSNRRRKAVKRLAKHHLHIARQRQDFHYKTAKRLLDKYDVIGFEDLNIKALVKTRMAKSILDAGWSEFLTILVSLAESAGKLAIAVNPNGTTQNCSSCGTHIPKTIADRWHSCYVCGLELDRDVNAAINVKNLAVGQTVNKAQRVSDAMAGLAENPTLYSSAS